MEPITINLHYLVQLKRFDLGACFQFKIVSLGLQKSFRGVKKKTRAGELLAVMSRQPAYAHHQFPDGTQCKKIVTLYSYC